jgi:DNA-binding response OmpR family regulator
MRFLLVSEQEEFKGKAKKTASQEYSFGIFLTPDELMRSSSVSEFDCAICDPKYFIKLKTFFNNPIFLLSSTVSQPTWIEQLHQGADGVVFEDLPLEGSLALAAASLRRWRESRSTKRHLPKFDLLIDLERYRVELKGHVLDLTLTELKVLKELANEDDRVIPRASIQQEVFGQLAPGNRSLDVHVCSLRKKLRPNGLDVESVRGVGYRLLPFIGRGQLKSMSS